MFIPKYHLQIELDFPINPNWLYKDDFVKYLEFCGNQVKFEEISLQVKMNSASC